MNKFRCVVLALLVICLLCGCATPVAQPETEPTEVTTEPTEESTEPETEAPTEPPVPDTARELIRNGEYQAALELLETVQEDEEVAFLKLRAELGDVAVGDQVTLGSYEQDNVTDNGKEEILWVVLAVEEEKALLVSLRCLDTQPYHDVIDGHTTWADSTLRQWLNEDFLTEAFSETEQLLLEETELANPDNPFYWTPGGENTVDRVFLLNREEAMEYLTGELKRAEVTDYAYAKGCYRNGSRNGWWWLRSPGVYSRDAMYLDANGELSVYGYIVHRPGWAIRPAIWIDLSV